MTSEVFNRMIEEFNSLAEKVESCKNFIESENFQELEPLQRDLLVTQYKAMETYLWTLHIRIGLNNQNVVSEDNTELETDAQPISEPVILNGTEE